MKKCYIPIVENSKKTCSLEMPYINFAQSNGYLPVPLFFKTVYLKTEIKGLENFERCADESDQDILLLTGGGDITPEIFGYTNLASRYTNPSRDMVEHALIKIAIQKHVPIFGICRGLQIFFVSQLSRIVAYWQHISEHPNSLERSFPAHTIALKSKLLERYKDEDAELLSVNSLHHQAIQLEKKTYEDMNIKVHATAKTNRKPIDIIEAAQVFKKDELIFAGVQWHPEEMPRFSNLINVMMETQ
jgi:putative glutamine amidotransferase